MRTTVEAADQHRTQAYTSAARADFRAAMAGLSAAVNIITTDGPAGRAGFTATAVCSVSDDPPTLLVCLNRSASVYEAFAANQSLCVNTLAAQQQDTALMFSGSKGTPMHERFSASMWEVGGTNAPALRGALAQIDCTVAESVTVGTHDVLICRVRGVNLRPDCDALVYFDRRFHAVTRA